MFRLLVWSIPLMFLRLLGGYVLYVVGKQHYVTKSMFVVGVVNITLNLIAIPRWSYLGAVGVALFSELLLCGLLYSKAHWELASEEN